VIFGNFKKSRFFWNKLNKPKNLLELRLATLFLHKIHEKKIFAILQLISLLFLLKLEYLCDDHIKFELKLFSLKINLEVFKLKKFFLI